MPAYAREGKDGKVIVFFKPKSKFKVRYSTFGFQPDASLDDGDMWPTEFAVIKLTTGGGGPDRRSGRRRQPAEAGPALARSRRAAVPDAAVHHPL